MTIKIKEHSRWAQLAARKLNSPSVAMVLGKTIHLWNVSRDEFLRQPSWVLHELEHVRQFRLYGFIRFIVLYLLESWRHGYFNNRFEVAARRAEGGVLDRQSVAFV